MLIEVQLSDCDIERIAARVAHLVAAGGNPSQTPWLDVKGAAAHLGLSADAIRALVKRHEIPVHRTPNRRVRFSVTELDEWVRSELAQSATEDLP
jgi:excisionase family DNA binding protein